MVGVGCPKVVEMGSFGAEFHSMEHGFGREMDVGSVVGAVDPLLGKAVYHDTLVTWVKRKTIFRDS